MAIADSPKQGVIVLKTQQKALIKKNHRGHAPEPSINT